MFAPGMFGMGASLPVRVGSVKPSTIDSVKTLGFDSILV